MPPLIPRQRLYFDPTKKAQVVRLLIAKGADLNARDWAGRTPLFAAAEYDLEMTKALLDAGADANARTSDGYNPLHMVGNAAIAKLLLDHGADVNAKDKWEPRTPLHFAERHSDQELI